MPINNMSPSAENTGPNLLILISAEILDPVSHIFNLSYATGTDSHSLKSAEFIHSYKKEIKSQSENCRSINLLSVFDKMLAKN